VNKIRIALPYVAIVLGVITIVAGIYAISEGSSAKNDVQDKLGEQNITLTEDAGEIVPGAQPGAVVDTPTEADQMAQVINAHALEAGGGLTYSEMGRFATEDGDPAGTNDPEQAVQGPNGSPVPNPARNTAFQAAALQTSLYSSFMGFKVADFVLGFGLFAIAVGIFMIFAGVAFLGAARILFGDRNTAPARSAAGNAAAANAAAADKAPANTPPANTVPS
jgi:hypothetical protein